MDEGPLTAETPRDAGARIEGLLDELAESLDPRAYGAVEDLVRQLTDLYGAALERVVALLGEEAPELLTRLADDELVASLLIVHGIHPADLETRVQSALQSVRPFLAHHAGDVELLAIDPEAGAVRLRLLGSCDGCPSSSVTLQLAVERAIGEAAPEIVRIDVDEVDDAVPAAARLRTPVALTRKPLYDSCPSELTLVADGPGVESS
jgi:Fe-S cluster biogenesis protein NfuA